jgi:predicted acyltransferase
LSIEELFTSYFSQGQRMSTASLDRPSDRLLSLDAFRGATVAGMILVNNPGTWGALYPQLEHARWNGWTFTDLIFPFFLWIVGVAIHFAFTRRMQKGAAKKKLFLHALQRSLIIFGLGLFLSGFPFGLLFGHHFLFATIRIPGVLQRIAVCYLAASAIWLWSGLRTQILWVVGLFSAYWVAFKLIPVPGYGAGVLEPMGNLPWYIDSHVLAGHTWSGAPVPGFDPEGIMSSLPAIGTTLLGVLTGRWLLTNTTKEEKTAWMFVAGNVLLLLGAVLDMWMPINKNLWTPTFSIFMCGWALVCLAVFYWLIDVKGYIRWSRPFQMYGVNAIAVFVLSGLVARLLGLIKLVQPDGSLVSLQQWLFHTLFLPLGSPVNASLLYAIGFNLVMFTVVWGLWVKKIIIKV